MTCSRTLKSLSFGNGDPNSASGFPGARLLRLCAEQDRHQDPLQDRAQFWLTRPTPWPWPTNGSMWPPTAAKTSTRSRSASPRVQGHQDRLDLAADRPGPSGDAQKELPEATKTRDQERFFYNYAKTDARVRRRSSRDLQLSGFKPSTNAQLTPITSSTCSANATRSKAGRGRQEDPSGRHRPATGVPEVKRFVSPPAAMGWTLVFLPAALAVQVFPCLLP